jgi:YfiH family protein
MKKILTAPNIDICDGVIHGFTTKELGADRDLIAKELGVSADQIFSLTQIHSDKVVCLDQIVPRETLPEGDALITKLPGIIIGVKTADCMPILVCDKKVRVVAAIHAGWRGLAAGIVQKTLAKMMRQYGCRFENMEFAFGPCISETNFEVGPEVLDQFRETYGVRFSYHQQPGKKAHLDLVATARMIFEDFGFYHRNMGEIGLCTFEREDLFFSHRRKAGEGRQFNFIGLKN